MNRKALSQVMRRAQIADYAYRLQLFNDGWFSVANVAKHLGVTPSNKLKKIIAGMVDLGVLEERCETYHGAVKVRYLFRMPKHEVKHHETRNPGIRRIVINGKVHEVGSN